MTTSPSDDFITGQGAGWRSGYLAGVMAERRRAWGLGAGDWGLGAWAPGGGGGSNAPGGGGAASWKSELGFFACLQLI